MGGRDRGETGRRGALVPTPGSEATVPLAPERRTIARRFDRGARDYARVTPVQDRMRRRLLAGILRRCRGRAPLRILELGCGTGGLTGLLREALPAARIEAVDFAPGMIAAARRAFPDAADFRVADAECVVREDSARYDLVVSNAAAQWFGDPASTLRRGIDRLAPGGLLACATLVHGTFAELRASFRAAYAAAGRPPREHTLPLPAIDFWRTRFPDLVCEETAFTVDYPEVRAFLRAVQRAGASYAPAGSGPLPRAILRAMTAHYAARYPAVSGAGIRATYRAAFLYGER